MAERFDRWIAAPQNIALPQGYDEFLSQNELPCLIEGCNWTGRHLGNHVNFAHGIPVEEFKRAAGFNKTTGLCTPAVSDTLANRPHLQDKEALKAAFLENVSTENSIPPVVRNYRSLEGREHRVKAISLLSCGPPKEVELVCIACGSEFHPGPLTVNAKYCSIECRNKWYKENRKRAWLTCFGCGKDFEGSRQQELGFERGRPVFCGMKCRGRHNIKAALGMRGLSLRS